MNTTTFDYLYTDFIKIDDIKIESPIISMNNNSPLPDGIKSTCVKSLWGADDDITNTPDVIDISPFEDSLHKDNERYLPFNNFCPVRNLTEYPEFSEPRSLQKLATKYLDSISEAIPNNTNLTNSVDASTENSPLYNENISLSSSNQVESDSDLFSSSTSSSFVYIGQPPNYLCLSDTSLYSQIDSLTSLSTDTLSNIEMNPISSNSSNNTDVVSSSFQANNNTNNVSNDYTSVFNSILTKTHSQPKPQSEADIDNTVSDSNIVRTDSNNDTININNSNTAFSRSASIFASHPTHSNFRCPNCLLIFSNGQELTKHNEICNSNQSKQFANSNIYYDCNNQNSANCKFVLPPAKNNSLLGNSNIKKAGDDLICHENLYSVNMSNSNPVVSLKREPDTIYSSGSISTNNTNDASSIKTKSSIDRNFSTLLHVASLVKSNSVTSSDSNMPGSNKKAFQNNSSRPYSTRKRNNNGIALICNVVKNNLNTDICFCGAFLRDDAPGSIICDGCGKVFHLRCVNLTKRKASTLDGFTCVNCTPNRNQIRNEQCFCGKVVIDGDMLTCTSCSTRYHIQCIGLDLFQSLSSAQYVCSRCSHTPSQDELFGNTPSNPPSKKKKSVASAKTTFRSEATQILKAWFIDHFKNPYPNMEEKRELVKLSGLSSTQVDQWYWNSRYRYFRNIPKDEYNTILKNGKPRKPRKEKNKITIFSPPKENDFNPSMNVPILPASMNLQILSKQE